MDFVSLVKNFVYTYYINPIKYDSGYNIYNTLTYGIILILISYGIYKVLKKMKIKIDEKFFFSFVPFILLGSVLRVLEDAKIFHSYLLISPLIYFIVFFLAFPSLVVSWVVEKKTRTPYHIFLFSLGLFFLFPFLDCLTFTRIMPLVYVSSLTTFWFILLLTARKIFPKFLSSVNFSLILVHLFDASTTFTAIQFFGYGEKHVLANFLMHFIGPSAMFIIKIAFVPTVLYYLDKFIEEKQLNGFLKFVVLVLGLGPGTRNLIRMIMGV